MNSAFLIPLPHSYLDLTSFLLSFGAEPTNRVLLPKVVGLPPPAICVSSATNTDTAFHISLPIQSRDILDIGTATTSSDANSSNQIWIDKAAITIRNDEFNRLMLDSVKSDLITSLGFNLRPTDCELKLLGMRLVRATPSSTPSSTIELESSTSTLVSAEEAKCLAVVAVQVNI